MNNSNIWVISLKDSNRRLKISGCLNEAGLEYNFFDAIDGRSNKIDKSSDSFLTNMEAACALSHLSVYRDFINSGKEYAVILEDDVSVNFEIIDYFFDFINMIDKTGRKIFILGGQEGIDNFKFFVGRKILNYKDISLFESFYSEAQLTRACCYLITKDAARSIIEQNKSLNYVADDWLNFKKNNAVDNIFIAKPAFFMHPLDLSDSYLQLGREERKVFGILEFLRFFRFNLLKNYLVFYFKRILMNGFWKL